MALIAALCLLLYLAGNGRVSLWDRDEAWYAQTAREMVQGGDYVVPMFNGQPRYRKPILIYWLMASAYSVFGDNELGARFFSGVAGMITCVLTYRLGTRMAGRPVGLVASLMLAVAPFMVIESKMATTDAVLTATLCGALSCLWELYLVGFSWRWSLAFWFFIGVTILTKGPFGPAFVACTLIVWLFLSRQWVMLTRLNWVAGITLVLAVCLPWGVAIYRATHGDFYRVALGQQALGHSLGTMNDHRGFPGFYLAIAMGGMMPWTLMVPLGLRGVRQWYRASGPGSFLLGWMIGPMLMLEIMRTKLPQYYLPAFPAWALVIARGAVEFHLAGNRLVQGSGGLWRVRGFGIAAIAISIGLSALAFRCLPQEVQVPMLAFAGVLGAGSIAGTTLFSQRHDRFGWAMAVAVSWCLGFIVAAWILPSAENCRVARASTEALRAEAGDDAPIVLFGYREPSLVFYLGRPVPMFGSPKELVKFLDDQSTVVTLLRDSDLNKLRKKQPLISIEPCRRVEGQQIVGLGSASVLIARLHLRAQTDSSTVGASERELENRRF
jgi:4-amino-4-deoxy-L-arabinose transferase-like glycosyltransferase